MINFKFIYYFHSNRLFSIQQCREQYEKIRVMESVKKEAESEDDVSEDDRENPQLHEATAKVKNDIAGVELDPRFALSLL